jgi:AcrR family transcriptional regulator
MDRIPALRLSWDQPARTSYRAPVGGSQGLKASDGRRARRERTTDRMLLACRVRMRQGDFRPTVADVASEARVVVRTVFQAFGTREAMLRAALDDDTTRDAILQRILGADYALIGAPDEWLERIAQAAVFGRAA